MTARAERRNGGTAERRTDQPADGAGTVAAVLDEGARVLEQGGIADARREALMLWAAVAQTSPGDAWMRRDRTAPTGHRHAFAHAVTRRTAGVPAAYAVGTAAFRTLELDVDARVLIPRPETEGLVEQVLAWCRTRGHWGVAADIGTGSGCIALSLAAEGGFSRVLATDVSDAALTVARRNAARLAQRTPIAFRAGDLVWPLGADVVDVIVSNPPYITAQEWTALDPGVRDHEPRLALVGGTDGLAHVRALLRLAGGRLREGGLLALEVDCQRAGLALALARAHGWAGAHIELDLFGRERYLLATRES